MTVVGSELGVPLMAASFVLQLGATAIDCSHEVGTQCGLDAVALVTTPVGTGVAGRLAARGAEKWVQQSAQLSVDFNSFGLNVGSTMNGLTAVRDNPMAQGWANYYATHPGAATP